MKISCFIASGCQIATTHLYRCVHLEEQLRDLGHRAEVAIWNEEAQIDLAAALACDLIFLYRLPMSATLRQLIEQARTRQKRVIFDIDDLIFEPELVGQHRAVQKLSPNDQLQHIEGVRCYLETLEACDVVVTSTPLLAELVRRRAKPAYVHRNSLGREMSALAEKLRRERRRRGSREAVVVGYGSGSATHDVDFAAAAPALLCVLERFAQVELWIAGPLVLPAEFAGFGERVRRFPLSDWREWFALLSQMDVALAPLEPDNLFCRAKSEIKFVEAGALGVPVVASRVDPFRDAITDGEDGFLATSEEEWLQALSTLIAERERRQQIGERARAIVAQRHSPAARTRDLRFLLPQLAPAQVPPARAAQRTRWFPRVARRGRLILNWLVPEPFPGAGGDIGLFRMIRNFAEFGHDCQVYVVTYEAMKTLSTAEIRANIRQHFGETPATYHRFEGFIGNADASFATFWPTVENLTGLLKGGCRYYLVQDFEPTFYPDDPLHSERAENTYRAGLRCITLGPWLTRLLRQRYRAQADFFDFAVDREIYSPRPAARVKQLRVCFYARSSTRRRAYDIGIKALQLVKERLPEVKVELFGAAELSPPPPPDFVNRGMLPHEDLAKLFSSCDVGLVFSLTNPSFVPLEMMASGCAVVELKSERLAGILTHNKDAWLVDELNPGKVAEGISRLLEDQALRKRIVKNGLRRTRTMSWRDSVRQIEAIVLQDIPPSQRLLGKIPAVSALS